MIKRRKTRTVSAGKVKIGSKHPVVIQSMVKLATTDIAACVKQINALSAAGAQLVRIAIPTRQDSIAFAKIVKKVKIPLIADIHFSPERAVEAIEGGAAKIRLNPGNIKSEDDINRIIDCAKAHKIAIRIGINEASIRNLFHDTPQRKRTPLMIREMAGYIRLFEKRGFNDIVLSVKSSDVARTLESNIAIAEKFDYPIHLGLTHAGLAEDAIVPASVAIGTLLWQGIGDTIRISIAGDPVQEVEIAKKILASIGLYKSREPQLIVCPTCGRCRWDLIGFARQVKKLLKEVKNPLRVAVMGCVVNGPGEAADADIAVCAAADKGFIYKKGKKIATVKQSQLFAALKKEIEKYEK
ncbi:MAG: flavodoxin-dependent (E)-4-hydroxy-3-methylbut-2-enyl-diphosphate synthase [Planctomycetes bacterium]|nr:flavodoxin-dependent (E)-4-hydroxy-3-methylbut-2-enyl-diphosphate synthase [Planctomycetota bacterium]MBU2457950.1 flavodoxin-dependent (E)-4-hydroxy-3-methylbut-2-enyl-diphosphate synthase [Planctomycetota bacterium]MBU2597082.1 flavodoxin-dependent (E)-4-hydroxy-3-methylbut-2-enyl-diphosphate synthase [Planctomycetota bacterium]